MTFKGAAVAGVFLGGAVALGAFSEQIAGSRVVPDGGPGKAYPDGRPAARYRLDAIDQGVVLRHGDGPGQCDVLGARDTDKLADAMKEFSIRAIDGSEGTAQAFADLRVVLVGAEFQSDPGQVSLCGLELASNQSVAP